MIILAGAIIGIITGIFVARRRNGTVADILQYGTVFGMAFGLASLFITLILQNIVP